MQGKVLLKISKWLLLCLIFLFGALYPSSLSQAGEAQNKPPLFYLALGDSLTHGLGATETNYLRLGAFVPRITAALRTDWDVHVENHGIPGITSSQLQWYLQNGPGVNQSIAQANLITITIGGNDLLQLLRNEDLDMRQIDQAINAYQAQVKAIIEHLLSINPDTQIYLMGLYLPYESEHPLYQTGSRAIPLFNTVTAEVAQAFNQVHFVDVYEPFLNKGRRYTHIDQEDIHPNDIGYSLLYEAFFRIIENHYKK